MFTKKLFMFKFSSSLPFYIHLQGLNVARYAERCNNYRRDIGTSVRPSVCHALTLSKRRKLYDHRIF